METFLGGGVGVDGEEKNSVGARSFLAVSIQSFNSSLWQQSEKMDDPGKITVL